MADDAVVQPDAPVVQPTPTALDADTSQAGPTPATPPTPVATANPAPPSSIAPVPVPEYQAPPVVLQPVKRSGIGGIVDELRDALAPQTQQKVAVDAQGNKYVQTTDLTGGQKWAKIAGDVVRGAAAGYSAGKGAGNGAHALQAGIEAQDQQQEKQQQQNQQQNAEVRQATLDKFNFVQLQQQAAATAFHLTSEKAQASRDMVDFAQKQDDRYKTLGYADMGVHSSPGDLADAHGETPDFWKDVYAQKIVQNPEYDANGKPIGVHLWKAVPGLGSQLAPKGTQVAFYVGPQKPGDTGHIEYHTPTVEMTNDAVTAYNTAAQKQMQDATLSAHKDAHEVAETEKAKADASKVPSEIAKNQAETGNQNAEAQEHRAKADKVKAGAVNPDGTPNPRFEGLAQALYDGDLLPADLKRETAGSGLDPNALLGRAREIGQQNGKPWSESIIKQENKFANDTKTQAAMNGIDRIVGKPGQPGYMDQMLDAAQKAHMGTSGAFNSVALGLRRLGGDTAAKNFETSVAETRRSIAGLIGNPVLGGGESDKKLKQADEMLGKEPTLENLKGAADLLKNALVTQRNSMTSNNRFLQKRYGQPASQPVQVQPGETPLVNPSTGQQIVPRNGQWVDVKTGQVVAH